MSPQDSHCPSSEVAPSPLSLLGQCPDHATGTAQPGLLHVWASIRKKRQKLQGEGQDVLIFSSNSKRDAEPFGELLVQKGYLSRHIFHVRAVNSILLMGRQGRC